MINNCDKRVNKKFAHTVPRCGGFRELYSLEILDVKTVVNLFRNATVTSNLVSKKDVKYQRN